MRNILYSFLVLGMAIAATRTPEAIAQSIRPDATLGNEASTVVPNGSVRDDIKGGAVRGQNLFHSFREFNVEENREVYFVSPNNSIQNIVTRVTGNNPSTVLGTLGTEGGASPNLFLLNPNGVMFGKRASLDLEGSFFTTTGSSIQFGEAGTFSAIAPQSPAALTVNPSALLFEQIKAQAIVNQSQSRSRIEGRRETSIGNTAFGLEIPDGKTLALIGGDVRLQNGNLTTSGGQIELGSILGTGRVRLESNETDWTLEYDEISKFGLIELIDISEIDVGGEKPGNIALSGANIRIQDASTIGLPNDGNTKIQGEIYIFAEDSFLQSNQSDIVSETKLGRGSQITIESTVFEMQEGARITSSTFGSSDAGTISIMADEIKISSNSTIVSETDNGTLSNIGGRAGDIHLVGNRLQLTDSSTISVETTRDGDGGSISINVSEMSVSAASEIAARANDNLEGGARGSAGNIEITGDRFLLTERSTISNTSSGSGNGGDITLNLSESLSISGESQLAAENLDRENSGLGGNIVVDTEELQISSSSQVSVSTFSEGNAGNLSVIARMLNLSEDAIIASSTFGNGNGGNINLDISNMNLDDGQIGATAEPDTTGMAGTLTIQSDVLTLNNLSNVTTGTRGSGDAGRINIDTHSLNIASGSTLGSATSGEGMGGTVAIAADDILLTGLDSSIFAQPVSEGGRIATGRGGELMLNGGTLRVEDGAFISVTTRSFGDAGIIDIDMDEISLNGELSGLFARVSDVESEADGGDITITGDVLDVSDQAEISVVTFGRGNAGNIKIDVKSLAVSEGADISTSSFGDGNAGTLAIVADDIEVIAPMTSDPDMEDSETRIENNTFIISRAESRGGSGDIIIHGKTLKIVDENPDDENSVEISTSVSGAGDGGDLTIKVEKISVLNAGIQSNTSGSGRGGDLSIEVNSEDSNIELIGQTFVGTDSRAEGSGGDVNIKAETITLDDDAAVSASVTNTGRSGNIIIHAGDLTIANNASLASQSLKDATSDGGTIALDVNRLILRDRGFISVTTEGSGDAGELKIENAYSVGLTGFDSGFFARVASDATGNGGDLSVQAKQLIVLDEAQITSASEGEGNAGNIALNVDRLDVNNAKITTESEQSGGGNIDITANDISLREGSQLTASVFGGEGGGGDISSVSQSFVALEDSDILAFADEGDGGNITLQSPVFLADLFPDGSSGGDVDLSDFSTFFGNDRVDINASSRFGLSGNIEISDDNAAKNALVPLSSEFSRGDLVVAGSCLARQNSDRGSFVVTGTGGLPRSPYEAFSSPYETLAVRPLEAGETIARPSTPAKTTATQSWTVGDPIREAAAVLFTRDGRTLLSSAVPTTSSPVMAQHLVCQ